jgi:hypothetical protein
MGRLSAEQSRFAYPAVATARLCFLHSKIANCITAIRLDERCIFRLSSKLPLE